MGFESNGRPRADPADERLNVFALVIYIPDPLGQFLDDLRRELVPHYNPHAPCQRAAAAALGGGLAGRLRRGSHVGRRMDAFRCRIDQR